MLLSIFLCVYLPPYVNFGEVFIQIFCSFLIGLFVFSVLSVESFLHILDTFFFYKIYALQRFSTSLWLVSSFFEDKILKILMQFNWSICSFIDYASGVVSKKSLLIQRVTKLIFYFFFWKFNCDRFLIVIGFKLYSMICFELVV